MLHGSNAPKRTTAWVLERWGQKFRRYAYGSKPLALKVAIGDYRLSLDFSPATDALRNLILRPVTKGLIACSAVLLSISSRSSIIASNMLERAFTDDAALHGVAIACTEYNEDAPYQQDRQTGTDLRANVHA